MGASQRQGSLRFRERIAVAPRTEERGEAPHRCLDIARFAGAEPVEDRQSRFAATCLFQLIGQGELAGSGRSRGGKASRPLCCLRVALQAIEDAHRLLGRLCEIRPGIRSSCKLRQRLLGPSQLRVRPSQQIVGFVGEIVARLAQGQRLRETFGRHAWLAEFEEDERMVQAQGGIGRVFLDALFVAACGLR